MLNLFPFIAMFLGQSQVGSTPEHRGTCMGLIERWQEANGKLHVWGDAAALLNNADVRAYRVFHYKERNVPPPGSILVIGQRWKFDSGHAAIVVSANSEQIAVFEQDYPIDNPCVVSTRDYSAVIGWLSW